jgi:hypothetical protein
MNITAMKTYLIFTFFLFCALQLAAQFEDNSAIPDTWAKDFTITLRYSGSMDGSSTLITYTYDAIQYAHNPGMKPKKEGSYKMKESDRAEILKKLRAYKIENVKSETSIAPVNDGHAQLLCYGHHCINGGTSAVMSDEDKDVFNSTYNYLHEFAANKTKR